MWRHSEPTSRTTLLSLISVVVLAVVYVNIAHILIEETFALTASQGRRREWAMRFQRRCIQPRVFGCKEILFAHNTTGSGRSLPAVVLNRRRT